MTNLYNGWTRDPEVKPMPFPINVPGYGEIRNYRAWETFKFYYKCKCDTIEALERAVAHLEIEKEMLQERIDMMLLLETELA